MLLEQFSSTAKLSRLDVVYPGEKESRHGRFFESLAPGGLL